MYTYKDTDGQHWFVGIYSNNFEDRQGDILSWEGHVEYAKWLKDNGIKLPITILHQPKFPVEVHLAQFIGLSAGMFTPEEFSDNYMKLYKPFAFAQTEAVIPISGFMLVIGKVLKGKEKTVQLLSKSSWGMSHGYVALSHDGEATDQYRSFEFTALPTSMAANILTTSSIKEIIKMDVFKSLSEEDRTVLAELLKGDPSELEESLGTMQTILSKLVKSKDVTEEDETEDSTEDVPVYEELREKIFSDLGVEELQKAFTQIVDKLESVDLRFDGFEGRIKQTEQSEDDRIASKFTKPSWTVGDKSTETELTEEEMAKLKEDSVGDKPLPGMVAKETDTDPLTFTWKNMVIGQQ